MKKLFLIVLCLIGIIVYAQLDIGLTKKKITITSDPVGANVYLDEKSKFTLLGNTPLSVEIKIGSKNIKLVKEGYEAYLAQINTQTMNELSVVLKKLPGATLVVNTDVEDADIYLDDKKIGKSGKPILVIKMGKFSIKLVKKGFPDRQKDIELSEIKTYQFQINMKTASLLVKTIPADAEVYLDGKRIEANKEVKDILLGEYGLYINKKGYESKGRHLELKEEKVYEYKYELVWLIKTDGSFTDFGDGTIKDSNTGYVWQKGYGGGKDGIIWEDAINYCSHLKLAEKSWELPNIDELKTLITKKENAYGWYISDLFTESEVGWFWSSTPTFGRSSYAYYVNIERGFNKFRNKEDNNLARCIARVK